MIEVKHLTESLNKKYSLREEINPNFDYNEFLKLAEYLKMKTGVKALITALYPDDDLCQEINDDITFGDVKEALDNGTDIYDVIGVGDSVIREYVFKTLADILNVSYDDIYSLWVYGYKNKKLDERFSDEKNDFEDIEYKGFTIIRDMFGTYSIKEPNSSDSEYLDSEVKNIRTAKKEIDEYLASLNESYSKTSWEDVNGILGESGKIYTDSDLRDIYYDNIEELQNDYHYETFDDFMNWLVYNMKSLDESLSESKEDFAGWVAMYDGNKIEITKDEANSIYDAKQLAIKKLKVPKSKIGLLAIKPGYNESLKEGYEKYPRTMINFDDDTVIVYDGDEEIYRGVEDYEPMKDENWKWDEKTKSYVLDNYRKICIESLNEKFYNEKDYFWDDNELIAPKTDQKYDSLHSFDEIKSWFESAKEKGESWTFEYDNFEDWLEKYGDTKFRWYNPWHEE